MKTKRIFLATWEALGFPEWDVLVDEEGRRHLIEYSEKHGWVRPDFFVINIEDIKKCLKENTGFFVSEDLPPMPRLAKSILDVLKLTGFSDEDIVAAMPLVYADVLLKHGLSKELIEKLIDTVLRNVKIYMEMEE